jgi:hypothetical protein
MLNAIVCKLSNIRSHPNADRLRIATASGYPVIIGLTETENDLGIVFPAGGQLSDKFCRHHQLYRKDPDTGNPWPGYLCEKGRTRTVRLRGAVSEALWMPINKLELFGTTSKLKQGDLISELDGKTLFKKYEHKIKPVISKNKHSKNKKKRLEIETFLRVGSTAQLRDYLYAIPAGTILNITQKCHGTSGRTGMHLVPLDLNWAQKLWYKLIGKPTSVWTKISGTRRTICMTTMEDGFGGKAIRERAHNLFTPRKGETFYYEIVGYAGPGTPVMAKHKPKTDSMGKQIKKQYGSVIIYNYGCTPGESKVLVYKITRLTPEGDTITLSPAQAQARTKELGLEFVPHIDTIIYDGNPDSIIALANELADGRDLLNPSHPREGVVIVAEHPDFNKIMKWKGVTFAYLEEIKYSDPNYIDPESIN